MNYEIALSPTGHLYLWESNDEEKSSPVDFSQKKCINAFQSSQTEGLLNLANTKQSNNLSPSFAYWRDFSRLYISRLCRTPEFFDKLVSPIEPPEETELLKMLSAAPPVRGTEYLNIEVLKEIWFTFDENIRQQISETEGGLNTWLSRKAPAWHQVGRVCLHLAENKNDPEFPFAFMSTYAPQISGAGRVQYQPLGKAIQEYAGEKNKKALTHLLTPIQRAAEKIEFIRELVDEGDIFHPLFWTPAEAYLLLKNIPVLEESGLLVRVPDWWRKRPRPRVGATIGEKSKGLLGFGTMLDFNLSVALGDQELSPEELEQILNSTDGLSYIKGQWVEVDKEKLSEVLSHWKNVENKMRKDGISFIEGMRLLSGAGIGPGSGTLKDDTAEWSFVNPGSWLSETLDKLRDPDGENENTISPNLQGTLRNYQKTGHNWLFFLANLGLGACLADDMGLGKTIQILSFLLSVKERAPGKPTLLILPASLLANWKTEIQCFAPGLNTCFVHPSENDAKTLSMLAENPEKHLQNIDLVLCTYAMVLRQKWLSGFKWRFVIIDEAQAIKNPQAMQTKTIKKLQADARIALTGTPVENRLSELWSLFDFICPGLLGTATAFRNFVKGLEQKEKDRYAPLRNLVRPYILRRMKTDKNIISDLPDKTEIKTFCGLSEKQAAVYSRCVEELRNLLENLDGIKRRGMVLSYLLKFKQICNHPGQFSGDGVYEPADSGKFERLQNLCEEIAARQEKILIFTQFREMTEPIADFLSQIFSHPGLVLHGGTAVKNRLSLVEQFQKEDGPPFFVLSIKAGGTGLNLTAASHVIHFDRWWNPAVENQATDRAFRIGQRRNVLVHKFVCRGTIEQNIDELIDKKTGLSEDILKAGAESLLTEMSNEELLNIVSLDLEKTKVSGG